MPSLPSTLAPLNERATRLFTYLKELTALNLTRVLNVEDYDTVIWFSALQNDDHCRTIVHEDRERDDEVWIEIKKVPEPKPPTPPGVFEGWYSPDHLVQTTEAPKLRERKQIAAANYHTGEPAKYAELSELPELNAAWQSYLGDYWQPWALKHRAWKKHHANYSALFVMEQQSKRLGEAYETVVGVGLLCWRTPGGERIQRHLITAKASLSFENHSGTITVRAAADGAKSSMEYDMLDPDCRPTPDVIKACEAIVAGNQDEPFSDLQRNALRSWVNATSDQGAFNAGAQRPDEIGDNPVVAFAPALILRKRSRRSMIAMLDGIASRLKDMQPEHIPFGVRRLCEIVSEDDAPTDAPSSGTRMPTALPGEIYFPLLSNDEQRLIVERLRSSRGVLVQGPPGTGKSQTVANLICHLLAKGKRILVTSQTERALKVLQGKLPPQLQPLCVTVLGADDAALKNMERSVMGINERHTDWDPAANARRIQALESEMVQAREAKGKAEARLRHLREIDFQQFRVAGGAYSGTAAAVALRLESERDEFAWISSQIPEVTEPPLDDQEASWVVATLAEIAHQRRAEILQGACIPKAIPSVSQFAELVRAESEAKELHSSFAAHHGSANSGAMQSRSRSDRSNLRSAGLRVAEAARDALESAPDWVALAVSEVQAGRSKSWKDVRDSLHSELSALKAVSMRALRREIHLPERDRTIVRGDVSSLVAHLEGGGKLGWGPFRAKVVKQCLYLTKEARVDGKLCDTLEQLRELAEQLGFEKTLSVAWLELAAFADEPSGSLSRRFSEITIQADFLEKVMAFADARGAFKTLLVGGKPLTEPTWSDAAAVGAFLNEIAAADAEQTLKESKSSFGDADHELATAAALPGAHRSILTIRRAIAERDVAAFAAEVAVVDSLRADKEKWTKAKSLLGRLSRIAPGLATDLEAAVDLADWRKKSQCFVRSWNWRRARTWLDEFLGGLDADETEAEIKRLEKKISDRLESLASDKAWRECLNRITESQRQHMIAWKDAIKRVGKGTGTRAEMHRQDARHHMEKCREAIPAWIMPFYRVAETVEPNPEPYDVVIVDEASQSGPEACALMYLAKRCIVVGDDKQISPSAVGIERAQVDALQQQYLYDIEIKDSFGAEASLFGQAHIRFGGRIRLREHFRCMPEIIKFSNDLCYQDEPLLPLRQYPPNRLEPIVLRHVREGLREGGNGRVRNDPEAKAVTEQILQCIADPKYAGKTMGVISLLGDLQAKRIGEFVMAKLDPKEIVSRKLAFGDAYEFQGDERDVIFLSMVAAPNAQNATLSGGAFEQRFNVAASRACDQIWLFHSLTTDDLSKHDLRYRMLSYYQNPEAPPPLEPDWTKCDSKFEERVGRIVHERGFRIIPQFEPVGRGKKRLDFVIEGLKARLAVECDGDEYHSAADDIHNDQVRQRQLERCGWRFWRLRQSEFHADREKSMQRLWTLLDSMGIKPHVQSELPPDRADVTNPTVADSLAQPIPENSLGETPPIRAASPAFVKSDAVDEGTNLSFNFVSRSATPQEDPVEKMILEMLSGTQRLETSSLILQITRRLDLGERGRSTIESAVIRLEVNGRVRTGANYVERLPHTPTRN